MRNRNHDEVIDLVRFAIERGIDISFIEEMPLGAVGDHDRAEASCSSDSIRRDLADHFDLLPFIASTGGPSRYFQVAGEETRVGFISPHSHNFCGDCDRVPASPLKVACSCASARSTPPSSAAHCGATPRMTSASKARRRRQNLKPRGHEFDLGLGQRSPGI